MRPILLGLLTVRLWAQGLPLGGIPVGTGSPPSGTTPVYVGGCNGSSTAQNAQCIWQGTKPSSGNALFGTIWIAYAGSVTSVCDGDVTSGDPTGCTGSSTYYGTTDLTSFPAYTNGTHFKSVSFFTCNFSGYTGSNAQLTVRLDSSRSFYIVTAIASGNSTSCKDGYNKAQATSGTNSPVSGTIVTTNAGDLMVGLMTNNCGGAAYTAGQDGQSHTYTSRQQSNGVVLAETLSENATGTYSAAATGPTCTGGWNAEVFAVK